MTYEIFAVYPTAAYLIATSSDSEHGMNHAEEICAEIGVAPYAYSAIPTEGPKLNLPIHSLSDLINMVKGA